MRIRVHNVVAHHDLVALRRDGFAGFIFLGSVCGGWEEDCVIAYAKFLGAPVASKVHDEHSCRIRALPSFTMRSGTTSGGHIVAYTMFWFMLQRMCFCLHIAAGCLNAADGLALIEEYPVAVQFIHTSPPILRKHSSRPVVSSLLVLSGIIAPEHAVDRVAAQPQEVREVLLHVLRVGLTGDAQE